MDIKIDNIESRMDKLEQKFDEMDRKLTADISAIRTDLKELMVSLQGNSIQEGMVVRTRKDIDALQDEMRHIRRNQLRDDQIKSLDEMTKFFTGWQFFVGKIIVAAQIILGFWLAINKLTGG